MGKYNVSKTTVEKKQMNNQMESIEKQSAD